MFLTKFLSGLHAAGNSILQACLDKLTCNAGAAASTHGKEFQCSKATAVAITARPLKYILTRLSFAYYRQKFCVAYKKVYVMPPGT